MNRIEKIGIPVALLTVLAITAGCKGVTAEKVIIEGRTKTTGTAAGRPPETTIINNYPTVTVTAPVLEKTATANYYFENNTKLPQAEQLGPWTPDVNGNGQNFAIDTGEDMVEVDFWAPGVTQPNTEFVCLLGRNKVVYFRNAAGTGWKWRYVTDANAVLDSNVMPHIKQRRSEGHNTILTNIEELQAQFPSNVWIAR